MRSKNSKAFDAEEAAHLAKTKALPCACCRHGPPNDAHHVVQGNHFTTIPLCHDDCHQGPHGIHGDQALMKIRHLTENDMLNWTIRMLLYGTERAGRPSRRRQIASDKILPRRGVA